MKRKKFDKYGHQYRLGRAWYNFCVKCGTSASSEFKYNCINKEERHSNEEYYKHKNNPELKSNMDGHFACIKCGANFISISYGEKKYDRVIERYYCRKYPDEVVGELELPCMVSDEEHMIKDIIS